LLQVVDGAFDAVPIPVSDERIDARLDHELVSVVRDPVSLEHVLHQRDQLDRLEMQGGRVRYVALREIHELIDTQRSAAQRGLDRGEAAAELIDVQPTLGRLVAQQLRDGGGAGERALEVVPERREERLPLAGRDRAFLFESDLGLAARYLMLVQPRQRDEHSAVERIVQEKLGTDHILRR